MNELGVANCELFCLDTVFQSHENESSQKETRVAVQELRGVVSPSWEPLGHSVLKNTNSSTETMMGSWAQRARASRPALNRSPAVSCLQWRSLVHCSRRSATGAPVTPSSVTWWWVGLLSYQPPPPAAWTGPRTTASSDTWRWAPSPSSESPIPTWTRSAVMIFAWFSLSFVITYFLNRVYKNVD